MPIKSMLHKYFERAYSGLLGRYKKASIRIFIVENAGGNSGKGFSDFLSLAVFEAQETL